MTRQLSLEFGNRHGGRRKGAGCKPKGPQAGVKHRPRAEFVRRMPVLVTQRIGADCPSLRRAEVLALFRRLVVRLADERFAVVHWSVQSNHLHLALRRHTAPGTPPPSLAANARRRRALPRRILLAPGLSARR